MKSLQGNGAPHQNVPSTALVRACQPALIDQMSDSVPHPSGMATEQVVQVDDPFHNRRYKFI
ncbi:MAG: hypothetical protein QY326_07415 [Bdellovibrionota bacterium]|nr:MAG: hypothetical protein QY326_07415 [Bdellovibrionota bacterium]